MRHLRIRARSSTGQVEGAARFLHGLAVQTVDGLPKATSPRCPSSGTAEASTDKDSTHFIAGSSLIFDGSPTRSQAERTRPEGPPSSSTSYGTTSSSEHITP